MDDVTDQQLIARFLGGEREEAFRALVERHSAMVYGCARRIVGDHETAQDVAQAAFLLLLRKASALKNHTSIAGWLYRSTSFIARDTVRRSRRREARERDLPCTEDAESPWTGLAACLDSAMEALSETDRHALLLRYFQNQSLRDVGLALGLTEDTAQKRVSRALDRLRSGLLRQGITLPAPTLASFLSTHAAPAAPTATQAILSAIVTSTVQPTLPVGTLLKATLKTLLMNKIKIAAASALTLLVLTSGVGYYASRANSRTAPGQPFASAPSPLDRLQALAEAARNHDGAAIAAAVHVTDSDHRNRLRSLTDYITAVGAFDRACRKAFGDAATDASLWNRSPQLLHTLDFGQDNLPTAQLEVAGEEARVNIQRSPNVWQYIRFQRVRGTWLVHEEAVDDILSAEVAAQFSQATPILRSLANSVAGGSLPSAATAMDELLRQLQGMPPTSVEPAR